MLYIPVRFRHVNFIWSVELWLIIWSTFLIQILSSWTGCSMNRGKHKGPDGGPPPETQICWDVGDFVFRVEFFCLFLPDLWTYSGLFGRGRAPANWEWWRWWDSQRYRPVLSELFWTQVATFSASFLFLPIIQAQSSLSQEELLTLEEGEGNPLGKSFREGMAFMELIIARIICQRFAVIYMIIFHYLASLRIFPGGRSLYHYLEFLATLIR